MFLRFSLCVTASLLCYVPLLCHSAAASDDELDDLLSMDIEELVVQTASKRDENIDDAPAVLHVVTAEEIYHSGARTLMEVLHRQPGAFGYSNVLTASHAVTIRGNSAVNGNHHTLLLLNGRPVRESHLGGSDQVFLDAFPLEAIAKIEIIRGPGSVLYGTNAFAGVINVVTKKSEETEGVLSAGYGSHNTRGGEGFAVIGKENYSLSAGIKLQKTDGWDFAATDFFGVTGSDDVEKQLASMVVNASYEGLELNAFQGYVNDAVWGYPTAFPFKHFWHKQRLIDLGYKHDINDDWAVSFNSTITSTSFHYEGSSSSDTNDFLGEITLRGAINERTNLLFGGTIQRLDGNDRMTSYDTKRYGTYLQLDHQLLDWMKLVGGVQLNKPQNVDRDFSPRLAVILNPEGNWGAKLMYGQAFRTAYPLEQFISIPGFLQGDPTLSPEKIETFDAQLSYRDNRYFGALTFFKSRESDVIIVPGTTYINGGNIDSHGVTFEGKAKVTTGWDVNGSVTWLGGGDGVYVSYPEWMMKTGVTWVNPNGLTLNVFNSYIAGLDYTSNNIIANAKPDDYSLLTANAILDLNKLSDGAVPQGITLSLYGYNLLNEDISSYMQNNAVIVNAAPADSGRVFYGKIRVAF